MRTTVDLPDPVFRQMKARAALRGITLREFILEAVQKAMANKTASKEPRAEPPLIRSKRPGAVSLTNAQVEDLLT
jgi:hypothetical protein